MGGASGSSAKRRRKTPADGDEPEAPRTPVETVLHLDDEDDPAASEEVSIDTLGRVAGVSDCGLDFAFRAFPDAVPAKLRADLARDCEAAFVGASFWIGASSSPRCALESLAKALFEAHAGSAVDGFDASKSGAEWWVQLRRPGDEQKEAVAFHWDKDEDLVDEYGVCVCPAISTVTYLSDCGAPTVVLEKTPPTMYEDVDAFRGAVGVANASFPESGKHIAFDGRMLHGAPRELAKSAPERGYLRVSFLVNVWLGYKPRGIVDFPESELEPLGLGRALSEKELRSIRANLVDASRDFDVVRVDENAEALEFKFGETGTEHLLRLPSPRIEDCNAGVIALGFGKGWGAEVIAQTPKQTKRLGKRRAKR